MQRKTSNDRVVTKTRKLAWGEGDESGEGDGELTAGAAAAAAKGKTRK